MLQAKSREVGAPGNGVGDDGDDTEGEGPAGTVAPGSAAREGIPVAARKVDGTWVDAIGIWIPPPNSNTTTALIASHPNRVRHILRLSPDPQ
ncbi:MAG: hypothetical protein L3J97_01665 [Thermoplasmata archaeon]|nr:hypothetical protein [Thermoplasmata archaeon]